MPFQQKQKFYEQRMAEASRRNADADEPMLEPDDLEDMEQVDSPEVSNLIEWLKQLVESFGPHSFLVVKHAYEEYRQTNEVFPFS